MSMTLQYSIDEFFALHTDEQVELIDGFVQTVGHFSGRQSEIAVNIVVLIRPFVRANRLGYVTGEGGGYILSQEPGTVLCPDVGFVRGDRFPNGLPYSGFVPGAPDLAVEVLSATDRIAELERKAAMYLAAGTSLVWMVIPLRQEVVVFSASEARHVIGVNGVIQAEELLPGLQISVRDFFS